MKLEFGVTKWFLGAKKSSDEVMKPILGVVKGVVEVMK